MIQIDCRIFFIYIEFAEIEKAKIYLEKDDWNFHFPTWKCEISSPYYKYHLLITQLTDGLVVMSFCFPTLNSSSIKKRPFRSVSNLIQRIKV